MTKSGTNSFHGTASEYHTNSMVSAKNFFYLDAKNPKNGEWGKLPKTLLFEHGTTDYFENARKEYDYLSVMLGTKPQRKADESQKLY